MQRIPRPDRESMCRCIRQRRGLRRRRSAPPPGRAGPAPRGADLNPAARAGRAGGGEENLRNEMTRPPFTITTDAADQPSVVSTAASDEIALGIIEPEPAYPSGYWIWGAFDNLRIAALNTAGIAERLILDRCTERTS